MEWIFLLIVFASGYWIATNWSKRVSVGDSGVHVRYNYDTHCWNCHTVIHASCEDDVWYGHKRCEHCNYFECKQCGSCFCKSPFTFTNHRVEHKWVQAKNTLPLRVGFKSDLIKTNNKVSWTVPNMTLVLWRQFESEPDDLASALWLPR